MITKLLRLSKDFTGTQYDDKIKNTDNKEFYNWMRYYLATYCEQQGWPYNFPTF